MNKLYTLKTLTPNSVITVFHGSDERTIYDLCVNGIDARQYFPRKTIHVVRVNGEDRRTMRGLFVSSTYPGLHRYSEVVIKFKTLAKHILHIHPSPTNVRQARCIHVKQYPKSFHPEISYNFIEESEKQGLYVGLADPRSIEKVWYYDRLLEKRIALDRESFLTKFEYKYHALDNKLISIAEKDIATYDLLINRLAHEYGQAKSAVAAKLIGRLSECTSFEQQIYTLEQYVTYSIAKSIVVALRQTHLPKLPSFGTKRLASCADIIEDNVKIQISLSESNWEVLQETGFWGRKGAGCMIYCYTTDRFLMPFRAAKGVQEPNTWGVWGGAIDENETPSRAALREVREECGYTGEILDMRQLYVFVKGSFMFTNFLAIVAEEFEPELNWETEKAVWMTRSQVNSLRNKHFGLAAILKDYGAKRVLMEARRDPAGIEKV